MTTTTTQPQTRRRLFLQDFGCQMNKNDAELVLGRLASADYERTDTVDDADVILYYTCSVREHAEQRVFGHLGALKRLKAERPDLVIGVMGCMAQNQKQLIFDKAPHVDLVVGTQRFEEIADHIEALRQQRRVLAVDEGGVSYERDISNRPEGFQAFVTIMRGCDKFCTFCIVPFTQGREQSRSPEDIEDEVKRLLDDGVRSVTLLGQRVNTYGLDLNRGENLASLLRRLEKLPGLDRLQFITSHPTNIDEELMKTIAGHPVHSRYLHLPVQSGSDRMLRAMNRGHDVDSYRRCVEMIRRIEPGISMATDWIVGYPGETDEDFQATVDFQREIGFQTSFVFKYSQRSGTRAARIEDSVPNEVKKERNQILLAQQAEISEQLNLETRGKRFEVFVEGLSKKDHTRYFGRNNQNRIVVFPAGRDFTGRFAEVEIIDSTALTLVGELV